MDTIDEKADALLAAAGDDEAPGPDDFHDVHGEPLDGALLTFDQFYGQFKTVLSVPGMIPETIPPFPIRSLAVQPQEEQQAEGCARAIYDWACEPGSWIGFLVQPQSKWAARVMAIGAFAVPKGLAVVSEIGGRAGASARPQSGGAKAAAGDPFAMPPEHGKAGK